MHSSTHLKIAFSWASVSRRLIKAGEKEDPVGSISFGSEFLISKRAR